MKKKIGVIFFSEINEQTPLWKIEEGYQFSFPLSRFITYLLKRYRFPQLIISNCKDFYLNSHWNWLTIIIDNLDFDSRFIEIRLKNNKKRR